MTVLLNISACNIKTEEWVDCLAATNEVLRLDPTNKIALYRHSKAISTPINASVDDLRQALRDLEAMNSTDAKIQTRMEKLKKQIDHNSKCERNVYGKMFFNRGGNAEPAKAKAEDDSAAKEVAKPKSAELSVSDYVEKKQVKVTPWKTVEDQEVEDELKKIQSEVDKLLINKECEFSFEIKQVGDRDYASYPEIEQLETQIGTCIQNYRMCRKMHKKEE